jgi:ATP-binding cassette, subfamily B, bacterial MsbA
VVEQGSNAELLARGGVYASLHRLQFREAAEEAAV